MTLLLVVLTTALVVAAVLIWRLATTLAAANRLIVAQREYIATLEAQTNALEARDRTLSHAISHYITALPRANRRGAVARLAEISRN